MNKTNITQDSISISVEMINFNNQLKLLKDQFIDSNILFYQGSQFTVNHYLLQLCQNYIDRKRDKDVVLLDDFQNPVLVTDLITFNDAAWNLYQTNLNQYHTEYQHLLANKGKV